MNDDHVNLKTLGIRFVYFDLGNVLITFDRDAANRNIAALLGVTENRADEVLHVSGLQNELEHGRIDEETFAGVVRAALGCPHIPTDAIMRAISDMFTPIETMRSAVEAVRRLGWGVGVLSNTCHAHWRWVNARDWSVMDVPFDATVLSCDAGSMKPDPKIYQVAEAAAKDVCDVAPHQILFLDDRIENVLAARARSWRAEHCFGGEQALDVLSRYGVPVGVTLDSVEP